MLLVLPGLVTKHSRNFIFTIILGLLANGPLNNLRYNFNKVFENAVCIYKAVIVVACRKQKDFELMLEHAKTLFDTLGKMRELLNKIYCIDPHCPKTGHSSFKYSNSSWQTLGTMTASSTSILKLQVSIVVRKINAIGHYVDNARICLTVISIIYIIIGAISYLRSYYIDTSFDNMYIGRTIQKIWTDKNYKTLIPLRHWEINEGYKVSCVPKFSGKYKVLRKSLVTFIFFIFVVVVVITDHLLAKTLKYIKDNKKFNIPFNGMNHNSTENAKYKLLDYDRQSCLSSPRYTSIKVYWVISLLLLVAVISCVFEVYISRIRAKLCNVFYPDRAEERADYLFYRIFTGRINRRYHLLLIVRREIERRIKLARFSPLKRFLKYVSHIYTHEKRSINCPGCGLKVKSSKAKEVCFIVVKKEIKAKICQNCHLDFAGEYILGDGNIYEMQV